MTKNHPDDASDAPPDNLQEVKAKAAKADEYLDLARRTKADFINYQDRIRRERSEWGKEAVLNFIQDFLPALDSFTWARFEEPTLMESLHLVEREFLKKLAHHHILPIPTAGRTFDPAYHEAVAVEETADKPPGTILEQVRRGWMLGDKVLRPAGVKVARAPAVQQDPARTSMQQKEE